MSLCSGQTGGAKGVWDCARCCCVWRFAVAVRVECAGAIKVLADRAKRNRPEAARRVGILARLAALAMAYDMAATQALQLNVSGSRKKVSGECCSSKRAYWRRNVTAAQGEGRNKLLGLESARRSG